MKTFTRFVLGDMSGAVVVHDRYQNYDAFPRPGVSERSRLTTSRQATACRDGVPKLPGGSWKIAAGTHDESRWTLVPSPK